MSPSHAIRQRNHVLAAAILLSVFIVLAIRLAYPVNLTAVDIGRHIKNGELLLQGQTAILHKNFYSFTAPDYPFINHHWFFGVMSYIVWKMGSFPALSLVYIAALLGALWLFMRAALLRGHFALTLFLMFLALPLLYDRREIRPEGISVLFMGVYFYVLTKLSLGKIDRRLAFTILSLAQVIWVNTHIFFFMGPLLVLIFLWEGQARGCAVCVRNLCSFLPWAVLLNLLNPSKLAGALTPLNIFKGFGYRLAENQNVFFMMSFFPGQKVYVYYLVMVAVMAAGIALAVYKRGWKTNLPFIVLAVFVAAAGIKAIRLMMPFGFFFVPLAAFFYGQAEGFLAPVWQSRLRAVLLAASVVLAAVNIGGLRGQPTGLGLMPGVNGSAEFFKAQNLKGPVFSNYDIGGYLIFHLAPSEKVFVDNRQEAFPQEFFKDVYVPMQENNNTWQVMDSKYGFNVIYFNRHDLTPWGQNFLLQRIDDPAWAPVFVDAYTIIFLKRNAMNEGLVRRFELPRSMFGAAKHS